LQKQLWGAHSPANLELGLNTVIKKLRAAFGDSADNPRFIETIPKHGYRFIAPVRVLERGGLGVSPTTPEVPLRGARDEIAESASTKDRLEAGGSSKLPNENVLPPETASPAGKKDQPTEGAVRHLLLLATALRGRGLKSACYGVAALLVIPACAVILAGQIETASQHLHIDHPAAKKGVSIDTGVVQLEEAVAAYRDALKEWTRERAPLQWAMTQNNLGTALMLLGERESGTGRLEEAVAALRDVLKERTREGVPLNWAMTENNFGNALRILGERESGTGRLEEAVAAFRNVLKERTRERAPLDWATTENDLGNALRILGERESGTGRLEEAVAAFRDALKERTRGRAPLDWAVSYGNQGVAMIFLA
jgi:exonuclease VII small subunit